MSNDNPYEPPESTPTDGASQSTGQVSPGKAAYNVVSDTAVGLNVRKGDNKFQALFIFFSILALAALGALLAWLNPEWKLPFYGGAMIGAFAGLVVGFFVSGIYLMIYRAIRHAKGKHD